MAGSVNESCFLDVLWNVDEELVEEEDGEGVSNKGNNLYLVAINPGGCAIEPGKLVDEQQERHGYRLERDDDQHYDQDKDELASRRSHTCECVGHQTVDEETQCDDAGDDDQRVEQVETKGKALEGVVVVLQREVAIGNKSPQRGYILEKLILVSF